MCSIARRNVKQILAYCIYPIYFYLCSTFSTKNAKTMKLYFDNDRTYSIFYMDWEVGDYQTAKEMWEAIEDMQDPNTGTKTAYPRFFCVDERRKFENMSLYKVTKELVEKWFSPDFLGRILDKQEFKVRYEYGTD